MLWCLIWHEVCLMCFFPMCLTYVGFLSCSNCLLCNRNWSDSKIDLMFPRISFFWGIAICSNSTSNVFIPRILLTWRVYQVNISPNAHFPEVSDFDDGFSVSNIFSLWNGVIAFKLQLRAEDVDTKFRCQHKIQIFKVNVILIASNLLMPLNHMWNM